MSAEYSIKFEDTMSNNKIFLNILIYILYFPSKILFMSTFLQMIQFMSKLPRHYGISNWYTTNPFSEGKPHTHCNGKFPWYCVSLLTSASECTCKKLSSLPGPLSMIYKLMISRADLCSNVPGEWW
jgi:hypothetical protein